VLEVLHAVKLGYPTDERPLRHQPSHRDEVICNQPG
jgi:hypothetical protein